MSSSDASLESSNVLPPAPPDIPDVSCSSHDDQFMKFRIGLRLLGKEKRQRFLQFLRQLQDQSHHPEGEDTDDL